MERRKEFQLETKQVDPLSAYRSAIMAKISPGRLLHEAHLEYGIQIMYLTTLNTTLK